MRKLREALRNGVPDLWAHCVYWKDSPSPPPPPDYGAAAKAQGAANRETAITQAFMGNPNIKNPYGSQTVTWNTISGGVPKFNQSAYDQALAAWNNSAPMVSSDSEGNAVYGERGPMPNMQDFMTPGDPEMQATVNQQLNPENQALLDQQTRISKAVGNIGEAGLDRVSSSMGSPLSVNSANDLQNKAEQAMFARLDPVWDRRQEMQETQLANQGIAVGHEAYTNAQQDFGMQRNDAYQQAILGAMQQRPQALQEEVAIRNQPLSELNALRTGAQPSIPQFQQYAGPGIAPPPIFQGAQAQGQADIGMYNAQAGQANAFNSGLMSLGGSALTAAMMFSDRRLKSNIVRIGTHPLGIGIYEYDIFDRHETGVMADEVAQVLPEAVSVHESGYAMVNYGML